MIDPEAVVAQVAAAFPSEPVPPQEQLLNGHCCECVEVSNAFGYKPWRSISLDDLRAGGESALLTPAAWRYYLPAVISWCVRAPESVDVIQDNLVYQLEPPEASKQNALHEWFAERVWGFTDVQRQAILGYLNWYRERQEAEYAALEMEPPRHVYRALEYWTGDTALRGAQGAG
jgi:hypothetical protein